MEKVPMRDANVAPLPSWCERVCVFVGAMMLTEAEELYQKRVLTITGICVALLVVGIVCVVAYCKTKEVP